MLTLTETRTPTVATVDDFERLLDALTGFRCSLTPAVAEALSELIRQLGPSYVNQETVRAQFYGRLNQKLVANKAMLAAVYGAAAAANVTFNYPTKKALAWAADTQDRERFRTILDGNCADSTLVHELMTHFDPVSHAHTKSLIRLEAEKPSKLRKAQDRDVTLDVFESSAGPLVWSLWTSKALHGISQPLAFERGIYSADYMADLQIDEPALFARDRTLVVRSARPQRTGYESLRHDLCGWIANEFDKLNNYGHLAILIDCESSAAAAWELAADLTLFAERFHEAPLSNSYFRSRRVAEETAAYVLNIDHAQARFDLISEGFTYRDLFVLEDENHRVQSLLLLCQKNRRDETKVPCPACRSMSVAGNSYPNLGVKSWECRNPLCPERSIYNRGKRYAFKALISQAAIEHPENAIPVASVRRWQRDVVSATGMQEAIDMLIRHYSMSGDTVIVHEGTPAPSDTFGRVVLRQSLIPAAGGSRFWSDASFFKRYAASIRPKRSLPGQPTPTADQPHSILEGDAFEILSGFDDATFDRAVTSPPYYNAREYAQWPNLYCYLHDMQRINTQVFRTLRPGALYAYNIFDYFDNERIVTFSAMGQKRIALSSLMVDLFRRIGFELAGCTVWDKGEIHGKRGFNAGNLSPYYQSPFNCWEHVLILRRPTADGAAGDSLSCCNQVLKIHPVVKMVQGKNLYGHTAPYPLELPYALLENLEADSIVLDPFGGSGTTGRAAASRGMRSVVIERDPGYCDLARGLLARHLNDLQHVQPALWP